MTINKKHKTSSLSQGGCLLPFLIFFNLLFGRLFLPPRAWLIFEGVLILLFLIKAFLMIRRVKSIFGSKSVSDPIDVEAEVLKEKPPKD